MLVLLFAAVALAIPAIPVPPTPGLRLIKTSEADAVWVTEEEKFTNFTAKHIHFADVTDTYQLESYGAGRRLAEIAYPSGPTHQTQAAPLIAALSSANVQSWALTLTEYYNRYYRSTYGTQAATWLFNQVKTLAAPNSAIVVSQYTHSYAQPSIIAKIPGSTTGVVIVSAHFDSIGTTTSGRAPGADDNASGVVVLMEALRVLAAQKFKPTGPTLEFHFYSGEEGGLLGSRDIMNAYVRSGTNVLAMVNQDMTGYSPNNVIAIFTDYVSTPLTNYLKTLVPAYTQIALATDRCGYGCSDHASAYAAGFPAAYVCDENMADSSPYIHSAQDTYATLNFPHIIQHAKFTVGFLVEASYFT